ncbi:hypothetical protein IE53DRAFT_384805 [Violaceomyces palustris]|uniref:Uncharacterized protein n=1 Tax=Violaceomyces palustris TaxID=1673888 RepID=A0ACD0P476_9BASI|nr:hypothetical protein IE53DRAFT_384805 [Violaceomyces palustris]
MTLAQAATFVSTASENAAVSKKIEPTPTVTISASGSQAQHHTRKTLTRSELAQRIANGEVLVLHRRRIYKLDKWSKLHPGGELAILHFVGRDATDEIEAYHSDAALESMKRYHIADLDPSDWEGLHGEGYKPLVPPVQLGYREGRLDHPHAQLSTWRTRKGGKRGQEVANEKDGMVKDESGTSHNDVMDPAERPSGFPLPVSLLEPPPNPPQINPKRERAISEAYREMHEEIKRSGLYALRPAGYVRECSRYLALASMAFYFWWKGKALGSESAADVAWLLSFWMTKQNFYFLLSSFFLGLFWHQLTFTAHDAGHSGITHSHSIDRAIGVLIADFIGGLSIGWWCDNHDVHHLVTNHPEHDPDIQHMPFFAISPEFLVSTPTRTTTRAGGDRKEGGRAVNDHRQDGGGDDGEKEEIEEEEEEEEEGGHDVPLGLWSSYYRRILAFDSASRFFLRFQHRLYYVVMSLGRFNLYANSYGFLALKARRDRWLLLETVGLLVFWTWFGGLLASLPSWRMRLAYLMVSHVTTSPLHVQIVLSHFAQSSEDLGLSECFASRQIRTTMDVKCDPNLDFVHGGLHMQVTHHLFPRLPRHNLREARDRYVKPFAQKWGLSYDEYGFVSGNGKVLDTLSQVAGQVELLVKVARAQAKGELH